MAGASFKTTHRKRPETNPDVRDEYRTSLPTLTIRAEVEAKRTSVRTLCLCKHLEHRAKQQNTNSLLFSSRPFGQPPPCPPHDHGQHAAAASNERGERRDQHRPSRRIAVGHEITIANYPRPSCRRSRPRRRRRWAPARAGGNARSCEPAPDSIPPRQGRGGLFLGAADLRRVHEKRDDDHGCAADHAAYSTSQAQGETDHALSQPERKDK